MLSPTAGMGIETKKLVRSESGSGWAGVRRKERDMNGTR